jgi:hypothetical protein
VYLLPLLHAQLLQSLGHVLLLLAIHPPDSAALLQALSNRPLRLLRALLALLRSLLLLPTHRWSWGQRRLRTSAGRGGAGA